MITLMKGDILKADAEALVNTVNCVGVMGRGIALQFRKKYPENYRAYKASCDQGQLQPGAMLVFDLNLLGNPRYIINFPTKRHWREKSRIEYIREGLKSLVEEVGRLSIRSIAVPPLGCGQGGLNWDTVRPMIVDAFRVLPDVHLILFEPNETPVDDSATKVRTRPGMTVGRATLLGLIERYLSAVMDPAVSLLEIHKLMYFMQEAGEPLRLKYAKAIYGPYAENLRFVLSQLEGFYISGYGQVEDRPEKPISLLPMAAEQAEAFLSNHPATSARFDRVADLIKGFETPYGMELLATVHWVAEHESAVTADQAVAMTYDWNERKRIFEESHIRIAWNVLRDKGWLRQSHSQH